MDESAGVRSNFSCTDAFVSTVAGVAFIGYGIVELTKWVFNNVKHLIYYTVLNLVYYAKAGWNETKKITVAVATEICVGMGYSTARMCKKTCLLAKNFLIASSNEVSKMACAIPETVYEASALPLELAGALVKGLYQLAKSGAKEGLKGISGITESGEEALHSSWSLIRGGISSCVEFTVSGYQEVAKLAQGGLEAADEATVSLREAIKAIFLNLWQYLVSGTHQLNLILQEVGSILVAILHLSKEGTFAVLSKLLEYLVFGFKELEKIAIHGIESFEEATSSIRAGIREFVKNLVAYGKSFGSEVAKAVTEIPHVSHEVFLRIKESGASLKNGVFSYTKASVTEATKIALGTAEGAIDILHDVSKEILYPALSNTFSYLLSGAKEAEKFILEAANSSTENGSIDLIKGVAQNIWALMEGGINTAASLGVSIAEIAAEKGKSLYAVLFAICQNLWAYFRSGGSELLLWALLIKEDLPDTFKTLIQDPLERFFAPKYDWIKEKLSQFLEAAKIKWAAFQEARRQRMERIRQGISEKLQEIRERVSAKLNEISEAVSRRLGRA